MAQNHYQEIFRDATAFLGIFPEGTAMEKHLYWKVSHGQLIALNLLDGMEQWSTLLV